jgi:hypothetical protein
MMLRFGRLATLVPSAVVLSVDDGLRVDRRFVREPSCGVVHEGGFRRTLVAWSLVAWRFVAGGYGLMARGHRLATGGYGLVAGGYRRVTGGHGRARRGMGS